MSLLRYQVSKYLVQGRPQGNLTHVAVGIAQPRVNEWDAYSKSQHSIHMLTEFQPGNDPGRREAVEWELWLMAYCLRLLQVRAQS